MKRSSLARKTPIARGTSQLKRSRMARSRPKGQPAHKRDDAFLAWVRRQPYCMCKKRGPNHAHHPRYGAGVGMKAADRFAISLCETVIAVVGCHDHRHRKTGPFKEMDREAVRDWEAAQSARLVELYEDARGAGVED